MLRCRAALVRGAGRAWPAALAPRPLSTTAAAQEAATLKTTERRRRRIKRGVLVGPSLADFLREAEAAARPDGAAGAQAQAADPILPVVDPEDVFRAVDADAESASPGTYVVETWGCQMNISDTELVHGIMASAGYTQAPSAPEADIVLLNTCAVRDNAEAKVRGRLQRLRSLKARPGGAADRRGRASQVVGVLGCMAERLKTQLLEDEKAVDIVLGPDSYRDLPTLLRATRMGDDVRAFNVQLSADETYADLAPVRSGGAGGTQAFVTIMRGCNNLCSFCIVPFTRGRERSRPVATIVDECTRLYEDGFREVVLLGQNVNSYHDTATASEGDSAQYQAADGFGNTFRARDGDGVRFAELLRRVARACPGLRIRFTSPHPKDFPDDVLRVIADYPNVCKALHMPAQSGSTTMLDRMRRQYSREAYIALADRIRAALPGATLSSDFIAGFCGETEEEHRDTVSLLEHVGYEQAFIFAYSLRERTHAARHYSDDVPDDVKARRLQELLTAFHRGLDRRSAAELGRQHLVLVEGPAKRTHHGVTALQGRTDGNRRVILLDVPLPSAGDHSARALQSADPLVGLGNTSLGVFRAMEAVVGPATCDPGPGTRAADPALALWRHWARVVDRQGLAHEAPGTRTRTASGEYVEARVVGRHAKSLLAVPLRRTSLVGYSGAARDADPSALLRA